MELQALFERAARVGASDLLITSGTPPVLRVNGELEQQGSTLLSADDVRRMLSQVLSDAQMARLDGTRELDFSISSHGNNRFRGNAFFTRLGMGMNFRLLPVAVPTLAELNLPEVLEEIALSRQGLVLVTGPTGHGKSTTLASMIDIINRKRAAHVVTIEDPIEYIHKNRMSVINQRQVGEDTLSFASALRHALRQSPDVILIGELRDLETISAALTAAETGHLVLSTLHTNDCPQAIDRLIDVFPAQQQTQVRMQLSMTLQAVLSQRLLVRADGRGRIPATELLRRTHAMSSLIRESSTYQLYSVIETQAKLGMHTMDKSVVSLFSRGIITMEEATSHLRERGKIDEVERKSKR